MIDLKTPAEIALMKQGGHHLAAIRRRLNQEIKPGINTKYLDNLAQKLINEIGGQASFLHYRGFPASICVSVNDQVVHGIPDERRLNAGDIVGLDLGLLYKGFHTDTAITVPVGEIKPINKKLISVAEKALNKGIKQVKPGQHLGDIQYAIQKEIEPSGFGIVRELCGHGIGKNLQEAPSIPNFGKPGSGPLLKEGMVLALEPMITAGSEKVAILADGWTIITQDGSYAAHFEHTIAVTKNGYDILTD